MAKPKGGFSEFISEAKLKTPVGSLMWVKAHTPDTNIDADGLYQVNIQFPTSDDEWSDLVAALEEINDSWFNEQSAKLNDPDLEQGKVPIKSVKDKDGNVIPGIKELRLNKKAYLNSETPLPGIPVFDTGGTPTKAVVGNGSLGKIALAVKGYKFGNKLGISLFPRGIRVTELKEFINQRAEEYDDLFDEDDGDGYRTSEKEAGTPKPPSAEDGGDAPDGADY